MAERQQPELSAGREPHSLRVGLLQTAPVFGRVEENLADIEGLGTDLGPVDLAVTPELSATGYGFVPHGRAQPLDRDDARLSALVSQGVGVGFAEADGARLPWNSYQLADRRTGARLLQRKLYPVSYAPWNEHLSFQPGDRMEAAELGGARVATVICNDMWHPVVPWLAAQAEAEVLVVPVASMEGADPVGIRRTWQVILEHAAILLQCYVVFVNRCGQDSGVSFWGGSRVLGPDGALITLLGNDPAAAAVELNLDAVRSLRAEVPILAEGRADLVAQALVGRHGRERRRADV